MADLLTIVRQEIYKYGQASLNARVFPILDDERHFYAVTSLPYPERQWPMGVMVMARVVDDQVIIEEDRTDHPLVDALIQAGIPRSQIILAYAGEASPVASA
jgi:hypothetical protein